MHGQVLGSIRYRLLVNALVDPDEAARRLPPGLRPHETGDGAVVGACLLALDHVRPDGVPAVLGRPVLAAAHRISVAWEDEAGATTVGVYVPVRHTSSLPARVGGGRMFPGVHRAAAIRTAFDGERLRWTVEPRTDADRYAVHVLASVAPGGASERCEPVGDSCLGASVGLSPARRGGLEAARMEPAHRSAHAVEVDELASRFLAGFATARPAPSYLMVDVPVRWTPATAPATTSPAVAA